MLKHPKQYTCVHIYIYVLNITVLVKANGVFLQGKHVVGKDNDFVVASFMEANEKLAGSEFVGVHRVHEDAFPCLDGHILSVKLWGHRAPHLNHTQTGPH